MKKISLAFISLALIGAGCTPSAAPIEDQANVDVAPSQTQDMSTTINETQKPTVNRMHTSFAGELPEAERTGKFATIKTENGDITFELFGDTAPLAASNFIRLAGEGYFDGLTFHRREEGFVIQGGDPIGNGSGGPGYTFADELDDDRTYTRGIVAMANRGPNTNGSQFFIMLGNNPMPHLYTIFGEVTIGMNVVDDIAVGDVMTEVTIGDK